VYLHVNVGNKDAGPLLSMCFCVYVCIHVCTYVLRSVAMYVCMRVVHVSVYVYAYVCIRQHVMYVYIAYMMYVCRACMRVCACIFIRKAAGPLICSHITLQALYGRLVIWSYRHCKAI
jgi:hypothetical protein